MTVIAMSRTEIDWLSVLQDLTANRIRVTEAAALMGLGRREVFRLAKAYVQRGPEALVSRQRGRPSNRCYPAGFREAAIDDWRIGGMSMFGRTEETIGATEALRRR